MNKYLQLLSIIGLITSFSPVISNDASCEDGLPSKDFFNGLNIKARDLKAKKLCAKHAEIKDLKAETIVTNTLCAHHINAETIATNYLSTLAFDACEADFQNVSVSSLCSDRIATMTLCVNGNVEHCTAYKAYMSLTTSYTYNLGDIIEFDTIVDDPNGDVFMGPSRYVAPKTGYYMVTFGAGLSSIVSGGVIAGIPVTRPEVLVNGIRTLKAFESFLSFGGPFQNSVLSGLVRLNAGDEVQAQFRIFFIDPITGVQPYAGSIFLESIGAEGQANTDTFLAIHYLSSDCPITCTPCDQEPCQRPRVECAPVAITCNFHDCCCESDMNA